MQYEVRQHEPTHAALAEAHAYGATPRRMVKTVALKTARGYISVALPASDRLDVTRVRALLGDRRARLALEDELTRGFPGLELGALAPFGENGPPLALVDRQVLAHNWVLTNGGDSRHSLRMSPLEIVRVSGARVVDIAQA